MHQLAFPFILTSILGVHVIKNMESIGLTAITVMSMAIAGFGIHLGHSDASAAEATTQSEVQVQPSLLAEDTKLILSLLDSDQDYDAQIQDISERFDRAWIAPTLESFHFVRNSKVRDHLLDQLRQTTEQDFGRNIHAWYRWLWNNPEIKVDGYDNFKAEFYEKIDPRFGKYFRNRQSLARIRLDEIRWGGVQQDGIPPLRNPKMLPAADANYLDDDNVVFGIEVNGDYRAYPKRILAWHEMFTDTVGGVDLAGVYCTLCGTVILYDTEASGLNHEIGTSGFLYRSNKLMYDKQTQSLWNTLKGEPVLGPLVDKGIALNHRSVVTTTWGKWKKIHPQTTVLSLETGHRRDYREGVAYHDYFATDELMFHTPFEDTRLENKREVLALRFKGQAGKSIAIDTEYLKQNPVYHGQLGNQDFVVITDETGANRVYDPQQTKFVKLGTNSVSDVNNQTWEISEGQLSGPNGQTAKRLPYHRAFWFGWHATYPNTQLVK